MPEREGRSSAQGRVEQPQDAGSREESEAEAADALQRIEQRLSIVAGFRVEAYKPQLLERRVARRQRECLLPTTAAYAELLARDPGEVQLLLSELLIGVTCFFREPKAFAALAHELEELIRDKSDGEQLRVWVPGCASGEEAYSIAMLLHEALDKLGRALAVRIFATDLDEPALAFARARLYPARVVAEVGAERLQRFFERNGSAYRLRDEIRKYVFFATHNLLIDPPFGNLDLVSCRNVLIYLDATAQRRALAAFRFALRPGGLLFLGRAERPAGFEDDFASSGSAGRGGGTDVENRIFTRRAGASREPRSSSERSQAPAPLLRSASSIESGIVTAYVESLLLASVPAAMLIDERGHIYYTHGPAAGVLNPTPGERTLNLLEALSNELREELVAALRQAKLSGSPQYRQSPLASEGKGSEGGQHCTLCVRPLGNPLSIREMFLVSFETDGEPTSGVMAHAHAGSAAADVGTER